MSVQHTAFVLKVLSGINVGASVRLKIGSMTIGRSMSCDIILHDEAIADQHVRLQVMQGGMSLLPLAQPVFLDGKELGVDEVDLQPNQVVRLGSVDFVVVDTQSGKVGVTSTSVSSKQVSSAAAMQNSADTVATVSPPLRDTKPRWGAKTYLMLGLGLLLLGNFLFFAPQLSWVLKRAGLVASEEKRAATLLEQLGGKGVSLQTAPDGSVSLRGYTWTTAERNALMRQIQDAGIQAKLHIWSQEEMVANAATIARSLDESGIKVVAGEELGSLLVQGFVSKSAAWARIRSVILADVGGIQSLNDDKLQSMDGYLDSFVQFVEKNGLSGRLKITTDGKRVIVKGELTQQEIERVNSLRQEFVDTHGTEPAIVLEVVDVRSTIKLSIRSVSVGKVPFLVAKDGKKYMEGSAIGEDYFVKTIRPDHVVLVNKGMEIPFYYGIEEGRK